MNWLDRRFPRFAFVRHLPSRRIAIRLLRRAQQRILPARGADGEGAGLRARGDLPTPIFAPRPISAVRKANGWAFTFLGQTRHFAEAIDWVGDADPRSQLWRMNLHYMEYLEVLPPADGLAAILDWIAVNPPDRAGAHSDAWNGYALSLRTVCWLQWLARYGDVPAPVDRTAIATSLAAQLAWLARRPETDLGGNHLIKNIKALAWGAAAFDGPAAARWHNAALRLLWPELDRQILRDGMHFERSPAYHAQVAADLIETHSVLPDDEAARLAPHLEAMVRVAALLTHPDGGPAQFGDAGLSMAYPARELLRAWPAAVPAAGGVLLPAGGFGIRHGSGFTAFVKYGPLGADALPAHAHGDLGSIELSWCGERLIVDQGVFEYVAGPRRRASRCAANHNVSAPDDVDMADFFGAFRLGARPIPLVRATCADERGVSVDVAHDGFSRGLRRVLMRRRLAAAADAVILTDSVDSVRMQVWRSRFLVHPDWSCDIVEGCVLLRRDGHCIRFAADAAAVTEPAVWWPDMGTERATSRIVVSWPAGMKTLTMQFAPA